MLLLCEKEATKKNDCCETFLTCGEKGGKEIKIMARLMYDTFNVKIYKATCKELFFH
jgi:hypothetical protein